MKKVREIVSYGSNKFRSQLTTEIFSYWDSQLPKKVGTPYNLIKLGKEAWNHEKTTDEARLGIAIGFVGFGIGLLLFLLFTAPLTNASTVLLLIIGSAIGFIISALFGGQIGQMVSIVSNREKLDPQNKSLDQARAELKWRKQQFQNDEIFRIQATSEYFEKVSIPTYQSQISTRKAEVEKSLHMDRNKIERDLAEIETALQSRKFADNPNYIRKLRAGKKEMKNRLNLPTEKQLELKATIEAQESELRKMEQVTRAMNAFVSNEKSFQKISKKIDEYLPNSDEYQSMNAEAIWIAFISEFQEIGRNINATTSAGIEMINTANQLETGASPITRLITEESSC